MGARLPLVIVGAVLMIVSNFLPTLYWVVHMSAFGVDVDGTIYYWIYGLIFAIITAKSEYTDTEYRSSYVGIEPDPFGITCMMIIIVGAILALVLGLATEQKVAVIGGVLGLAGIIGFFVGVIMALPMTPTHVIVDEGYYPMPYIGFFVCVTGGILALVGGLLERY